MREHQTLQEEVMAHLITDCFLAWADGDLRPLYRNCDFSLTRGLPCPDPSVRLDLGSGRRIGRITVWSSGACDAEVLDVETEKRVYWQHWDNLNDRDFGASFSEFLAEIRLC